jgi:Dual specificity phosphatase, catalytic domain
MGQTKLRHHAQEIVPGLWLGGRWACRYAREAGFRTICVLENPCVQGCFHAPVLAVDSGITLHDRETQLVQEQPICFVRCEAYLLKTAHLAIDEFLKAGSVLVHCLAGRERSPLVVTTWLCERHGFSLDEAYGLIISKRPIVERRASWLSDAERNRYGTGPGSKDRVRVEL